MVATSRKVAEVVENELFEMELVLDLGAAITSNVPAQSQPVLSF